jgi:RNA polymerase sigma-70 factor (ECF subfamily)
MGEQTATSWPAASIAEEFEAIVSLYRAKVFRFALASLRDRDAADSVTQDCFLKAYRAWGTFRQDCSLDTWLMQIAVNLIRDHARSRRFLFWKRVGLTARPVDAVGDRLAGNDKSPEDRVLLNERVDAVWDAAARLPERQRTVFLLRFVEDMDLLEIAAATGMKEGTVKASLFRSIRAVRKRMGAQE